MYSKTAATRVRLAARFGTVNVLSSRSCIILALIEFSSVSRYTHSLFSEEVDSWFMICLPVGTIPAPVDQLFSKNDSKKISQAPNFFRPLASSLSWNAWKPGCLLTQDRNLWTSYPS